MNTELIKTAIREFTSREGSEVGTLEHRTSNIEHPTSNIQLPVCEFHTPPSRALNRSAGFQSVVFGRRFALSAQTYLLSLSSSQKEERAGERRRFISISPLSGSLPARSLRGERGKTPQAFCVLNTTDFQSAVSPNCIRRSVGSVPRAAVPRRLAECNSAIQRSAAKPQPKERGSVTRRSFAGRQAC